MITRLVFTLIVLPPFSAANATFALNAGLWLRLGRLVNFFALVTAIPPNWERIIHLSQLFRFIGPAQKCGVFSICSKARERFSRLRMLIFFVLFVAVPQHSFANKNSHACPAVWQGYVQNIRAQIGSIHLPYPLLFVSRAGDVYDCLGLVGNKKFLEMASLYQKTLPLDRSSIITPDPAT